jgi:hypothetical protein
MNQSRLSLYKIFLVSAVLASMTSHSEASEPGLNDKTTCKVFLHEFEKTRDGLTKKDAEIIDTYFKEKNFIRTENLQEAEFTLTNLNPSEKEVYHQGNPLGGARSYTIAATTFGFTTTNIRNGKVFLKYKSDRDVNHKNIYASALRAMPDCMTARKNFYRFKHLSNENFSVDVADYKKTFPYSIPYEFVNRVEHSQSYSQPAITKEVFLTSGEKAKCEFYLNNFKKDSTAVSVAGEKLSLEYSTSALKTGLIFVGANQTEAVIACDSERVSKTEALTAFNDVLQYRPQGKILMMRKALTASLDSFEIELEGTPVSCSLLLGKMSDDLPRSLEVGESVSVLFAQEPHRNLTAKDFKESLFSSPDYQRIDESPKTYVYLGNDHAVFKLSCQARLENRTFDAYLKAKKYFMSSEEVISALKNKVFE